MIIAFLFIAKRLKYSKFVQNKNYILFPILASLLSVQNVHNGIVFISVYIIIIQVYFEKMLKNILKCQNDKNQQSPFPFKRSTLSVIGIRQFHSGVKRRSPNIIQSLSFTAIQIHISLYTFHVNPYLYCHLGKASGYAHKVIQGHKK